MRQRALVYNIAYGTGGPGNHYERIFNAHRYLRTSRRHLDHLCDFIEGEAADVVGLLEVDTGSTRSANLNQAEVIAQRCRHQTYCKTKYGDSLTGRLLPILRKQGNALLTSHEDATIIFHFFPGGFKRLVIEADMGSYRFLLVHLALSKRVRKLQLEHLVNLLSRRDRPVLVAGDFNTFKGEREIEWLRSRLDLINPNSRREPTYPAWKPRHQIDFILCSKQIKVLDFSVPSVRLSDHLPLVLDFEAPSDS